MGAMGIEALYRRPRTTKPEPGHKIFPYLAAGMEITRPNQVCDGHHLHPDGARLVYLAVVLDWFSRRVLSWRLSITMEAAFCRRDVRDALARHGRPTSSIPMQGSQFTGAAFTGVLADNKLRSAWTAKGLGATTYRQRLWRTSNLRRCI